MAVAVAAPLTSPAAALAGEQLRFTRLTPALAGNAGQGAMAAGSIDDDYYRDDLAIVHGDAVSIRLGTGSDSAFHHDVAITDPFDIALADLDGDKDADLIVSTTSGARIQCWKGDGAGGFTHAFDAPLFPGYEPREIVVTDLNHDSRPDVVFCERGTANPPMSVGVMITKADGTFGTPSFYDVTGDPSAMAVADLIGSSHPDIAVLSADVEKVTILENVAAQPGTFVTDNVLTTGNDPHDIGILWRAVGSDILVTNTGDDDLRQYANNGDGTFTAVDRPTPNAPRELCVIDLNMDWEPEVAVGCAVSVSGSALHLMRNVGLGADLVPAGTYTFPGTLPAGLVSLDFSREWKTDLVMTTSDGWVQRFRNISVPLVTRIEGKYPNRYSTSVALSRRTFGSAATVVIATGENHPDALCGVPLAHALDAPVLLVRKDSVPGEVAAEIARLGATKAILLGGTGAVTARVQQELKDASGLAVERIGGADRYETSYLIAKRLLAATGAADFYWAHVATGENHPDALAVAGFAAHQEGPVLLVRRDVIPAWTKKALSDLKVDETLVCGSETVVSKDVAAALPKPYRLGGADRYETARLIATHATKHGFTTHSMYAATGEDFPDALCAGVLSAELHYPLLLTGSSRLPGATRQAIATWGPDGQAIQVIGGSGAVSDAVLDAMRNAY